MQVKVACTDGKDGLSVLEHRALFGDLPPLHIHRTEDEVFHFLEGEFRFQIAGEEQRWGPGTTFLAPNGVAHTNRVESPAGGRWFTVTTHGDFERFVRTLGRGPNVSNCCQGLCHLLKPSKHWQRLRINMALIWLACHCIEPILASVPKPPSRA